MEQLVARIVFTKDYSENVPERDKNMGGTNIRCNNIISLSMMSPTIGKKIENRRLNWCVGSNLLLEYEMFEF